MFPQEIYSDLHLTEMLRGGDEQAFTQVYRQYSEKLYYNILAMVKDGNTAEELVQDIFSHIWQKRASLPVDAHLDAYLFTVSRNKVCDFFRQLKKEKDLYAHIREIATSEYHPFDEALAANGNAELLQKAIESLPPQRRKVFELCKLEGLSYREAGEQLGISLSTVKDHMDHAHRFIRSFVTQHGEIAVGIVFFYLWNNVF